MYNYYAQQIGAPPTEIKLPTPLMKYCRNTDVINSIIIIKDICNKKIG